ncbi:Rut operon repressor [Cognatishimia activa]|uniref:Rut operon repressor n=1 Tax=Cognatishimia activa TaxID=1715691 RepID=A0A0P1IV95_9RHOB|nr:TetR family transcriptional regulator C-terminal domain-containing protein [Cognatishimia activa]CUK27438.1 Rut operon repressor [Cognatishimia activa]
MAEKTLDKPKTRIQKARREEILDAALAQFSQHGFRGASVNTIAKEAGMSTPRMLYHFKDKEDLYRTLLKSTILLWLGPLQMISDTDEPIEEICAYVRRKLEMSRKFPRESRLFAGEILLGVPLGQDEVFEPLRETFDSKIRLFERWMDAGLIAKVDPHHLMYSIWATTQHYADFQPQIAELSPDKMNGLFEGAEEFLIPMFRKTLSVET